MSFIQRTGVCSLLAILTVGTTITLAAPAKDSGSRKAVRCCGLMLRTEFGNYEKLAEMAMAPDTALSNSIDSGKMTGLVEAFEAYLGDIDKEYGDSEHRDIIRTRLLETFKSVESDPGRSKQLMAAFREFAFASTLEAKGMKERSIEQVRKSRTAFAKAVPSDSFCVMPVDLYLATALTENGSAAEAATIAQSVVNRAKVAFGKRDEFVGSALVALGKAQLKTGNAAQAEQSLREGISIISDAPELQPNSYLLNCSILAETLLEESKSQEAAELMDYLEPQIRKLFNGQLSPPLLNAVMMRAKAYLGMNRLKEAEKILGRYPEMVQSLREPGLEGRNLLEVSADLLEQMGNNEQAAIYRKWVAKYDAKHPETANR